MADPDAPVSSSTTPLIVSKTHARSLSTLQGFRYLVTLHLVRILINLGLGLVTIPGIRDRSILPTSKKRYSCHQSLANRIYVPRSYKASGSPLPVYIHIHGGGFSWTNPVVDDGFCSNFSNNNNILVVSLDYPKSPSYRFPTAVQALADLVNAVLYDDSLPIDTTKVAIGGFSAGGNLACAVSQNKTLQGRIRGLVAFYPPANFLPRSADELATNPKGAGAALSQDQLSMFGWGYVEGELMAEKMASFGTGQRIGSELSWEKNGVKWEKILGEDHAFDQRLSFGTARARMKKRGREMHESAAEWLLREVYLPEISLSGESVS
ncbi:hypothetical protein V496_06642 [Pseudogymnoascus sp. VKM F-4515 (FW-2607)]|nr:hypothetical protein V496_06642 [Pseudogymnoascus sp. VKM F-4515 (FW-2607)]